MVLHNPKLDSHSHLGPYRKHKNSKGKIDKLLEAFVEFKKQNGGVTKPATASQRRIGALQCNLDDSNRYMTFLWHLIQSNRERSTVRSSEEIDVAACTVMTKALLADVVHGMHLDDFRLTGMYPTRGMHGLIMEGIYYHKKKPIPIVFKLLLTSLRGNDCTTEYVTTTESPFYEEIRCSTLDSIYKEFDAVRSINEQFQSNAKVGFMYNNQFIRIDVPNVLGSVALYEGREVNVTNVDRKDRTSGGGTMTKRLDFAGYVMTKVANTKGSTGRNSATEVWTAIQKNHPDAVEIGKDIYGLIPHAIAYMHANHYAHGDLHPGNLRTATEVIDGTERITAVSIFDFGRSVDLRLIERPVRRGMVQMGDYILPLYGIIPLVTEDHSNRKNDELLAVIAAYITTAARSVNRILHETLRQTRAAISDMEREYIQAVELFFHTAIWHPRVATFPLDVREAFPKRRGGELIGGRIVQLLAASEDSLGKQLNAIIYMNTFAENNIITYMDTFVGGGTPTNAASQFR